MTIVPVPVQLPAWVTDILGKIAGPAAEELGLTLRDRVRLFRFERQLRLLGQFKSICEKAGIEPKAVRIPLLFDILDRATLEEDDNLQDLWANLLANAADPRGLVRVRTIFPEILRHISKEEAIYLEEMVEINANTTSYTDRAYLPDSEKEMEVTLPPKRLDDVSYDNLKRLGVVIENEEMVPVAALEVGVNQFRVLTTERYAITSLGFALVMACRPPARANQAS
jgi:hypothetical protein